MASVRPAGNSLPWGSIASLIAAILYGVSPIDLIPDILPLIGWVDDVSIGGVLILLAISLFFRHMRSKKRELKPVAWRPK
jgi:uncharacterized membrane protein YkvA (DUF1232 family)